MPSDLLIRPYRPDDEEQVVALWKNHPVYRPEDQDEVDAMFGFREAFRSYVGKYELLWFEMDLTR